MLFIDVLQTLNTFTQSFSVNGVIFFSLNKEITIIVINIYQRCDYHERHVPQIEFFPTLHSPRIGRRRHVDTGFRVPSSRHPQTVLRQIHQFQFDILPESFLVEFNFSGEPFEVFLDNFRNSF